MTIRSKVINIQNIITLLGCFTFFSSSFVHGETVLKIADMALTASIALRPALSAGDKVEFITDDITISVFKVDGDLGVKSLKFKFRCWDKTQNCRNKKAKARVTRKDGVVEEVATLINISRLSYLKLEKLAAPETGNKVLVRTRRNKIQLSFEDNNMPLNGYIETLDVNTDSGSIQVKLTPYIEQNRSFFIQTTKSVSNVSVSTTISDSEYKL